jgi:type IV pilus assembly protein PilB
MVARGLLTGEQLRQAVDRADEGSVSLGEAIINLGFASEADLMTFISSELEIPFIDPREHSPDPSVLQLIPEDIARLYQVFPLFKTDNTLTVATADALNVLALDDLQLLVKCRISPVLSKADHLLEAIDHHYGVWGVPALQTAIDGAIEGMGGKVLLAEDDAERTARMAKAPPLVQLIDSFISNAVKTRASDIHVEPGREKIRVRYRVDGLLRQIAALPARMALPLVSCIKVLTDMDITERRKPQDARMMRVFGDEQYDIRVSTLPTINGEKVVMRLLPSGPAVPDLEETGLAEPVLRQVERILRKPAGLFLAVGPTGSGKTTTLCACLAKVPRNDKNVLSIEDPVEYQVEGVSQTQIDVKAGITFANTLRTILRQDPDVILVGEMRDEETASLAVRAAITGHLVMSTLHTDDAASTIARLLDMRVEPYLLASALRGVLSQRLIRAICPLCKQALSSEEVILEEYDLNPDDYSGLTFYKGAGCDSCGGIGYSGRIAIGEFMAVNPEIERLIAAKQPSSMIAEIAIRGGMRTIREWGMELVKQGVTTLDEVLRVTEEKKPSAH